jgi:hypothetical protein
MRQLHQGSPPLPRTASPQRGRCRADHVHLSERGQRRTCTQASALRFPRARAEPSPQEHQPRRDRSTPLALTTAMQGTAFTPRSKLPLRTVGAVNGDLVVDRQVRTPGVRVPDGAPPALDARQHERSIPPRRPPVPLGGPWWPPGTESVAPAPPGVGAHAPRAPEAATGAWAIESAALPLLVSAREATTSETAASSQRRSRRACTERARPRSRRTISRRAFISHFIVGLGLDPVRVKNIVGHASVSVTLNTYAEEFDKAMHRDDLMARIEKTGFGAV